MITNEWSTETVHFMTPGAGVLELGCGHILIHMAQMLYSSKFYSIQ